ncbi:MAG TPA: hypothetical protein H9793_05295, partial [Candidatus Brevibacterium intestinigallinarum]|nr:hypothetical protein [Candidatus Brevibacterium intestinigallinarum]
MDTSIAFLLIAAVLFVVIVPAALRRSAEKDEESSPERVRTVDVERTPRCAVDDSRPRLLRDESHPARVELPAPAVSVAPTAPRLSLRAPRPALEILDGDGQDPAQDVTVPLADPQALPLAVGSAPLLDLSDDHRPAAHTAGSATVIAFSPLDARADARSGPSASDPMDATMTSSHRTAPHRVAAAAHRMPRDLPADVRARLAAPATPRTSGSGPAHGRPSGPGRAQARTAAPGRAQAPARSTALTAETRGRIRRLRAVLPFCGLTVLGMALATLICLGFVVFGSLPWGVPVVTAALGLAGLALVRGLNKEIRALRTGTAAEAPATPARTRTSATVHAAATRSTASQPVARRERLTADQLEDEPITADLPIVRETTVPPSSQSMAQQLRDAYAARDEAAASATSIDATASTEAAAEAAPTTADTTAPIEDRETADDAVMSRPAQDADDSRPAEDATQDSSVTESAGPRTRSVFAGSAQTSGPTVAETLA